MISNSLLVILRIRRATTDTMVVVDTVVVVAVVAVATATLGGLVGVTKCRTWEGACDQWIGPLLNYRSLRKTSTLKTSEFLLALSEKLMNSVARKRSK